MADIESEFGGRGQLLGGGCNESVISVCGRYRDGSGTGDQDSENIDLSQSEWKGCYEIWIIGDKSRLCDELERPVVSNEWRRRASV